MAFANLCRIIGAALWVALSAHAETLSLESAAARQGADMRPLHDGRHVTVQGIVESRPAAFGDYAHVPIADAAGFGLTIEAPEFMLEGVTPGDKLEIRGLIGERNGLVVLRPSQITTLTNSAPPKPMRRRLDELQSFRMLARAAIVEGRVVAMGEDKTGEYLLLDNYQSAPYPVYLPGNRRFGPGLERFRIGDRVQITGFTSQAASKPPFSDGFCMMVTSSAAIALIERVSLFEPQYLLLTAIGLLTAGLWFLRRHRQMTARRATVRRLHQLCEDLISSATHEDAIRKLRLMVPKATAMESIELYRFDRNGERLERVIPAQDEPARSEPSRDTVSGGPLMLCFRNRTPLHIADSVHSPLLWEAGRKPPRSLVALPMFARDELVGVMEVTDSERPRDFSWEELMALQHLANQSAMMLRLLDQMARRDQLLRSEKMAAGGQLIKGVTGELKTPIESIYCLAFRLLEQGSPDARQIISQSMRASAILSRLNSVAQQAPDTVVPVDMNQAVAQAVECFQNDWQELDVELEVSPHPKPLWVSGSPDQMEQVVRNLLFLAARSSVESEHPWVKVYCSAMARRVTVSIDYPSSVCNESFPAFSQTDQDVGALSFGVCRGILNSNGGELRLSRMSESLCRMEIGLPMAFPPAEAVRSDRKKTNRVLTALLLEPDVPVQRRLVAQWSALGHRALPVQSKAEAMELLRRMRIDVFFCAIRVAGSDWVNVFDEVRQQVPAFVLLIEGLDSDESALFPDKEGFVLRKPVDAGDVGRLLERLEQRIAETTLASV